LVARYRDRHQVSGAKSDAGDANAQVELAGPLPGADRDRQQREVAGRIGALAGDEHRRIAALSKVSQRSTAADDFAGALELLLAGIRTLAG
jgi:hypothetical protein